MEGKLDFGLPRECLRHMSKEIGLDPRKKEEEEEEEEDII